MKDSTCIYIHWPWCKNICKYCDYYKFKYKEDIDSIDIYNCFIRDLKDLEEYFHDKTIASIHIGGGSPSIMKTKLLRNILEFIYKNYKNKKNIEVSLEANPEDIFYKKLKEYKNIGINRLNLGVQSFSDYVLSFLGRSHDKKQAISSIYKSSEYFENTGIDLIYGIPGDIKESFENQLIYATELPIKHISIYEFEYQNNFKKNYFLSKYRKILEQKKFFLYELNSYSLRGYQSFYNASVLGMNNYIGIGPSSHSRVWKKNNFIKLRNTKNIKKWSNPTINNYKKEILSQINAIEEFLFLGLSTSDGISIKKLQKLSNNDSTKYINVKNINDLKKRRLLFEKKGRLFLSDKGMLLINSIVSNLIAGN
ncbi:MAG: hypothetical protein CMJ08_04295 [Pelagibacterales bacterium]|nr:hypothetical protein [Pelagibacterales bacterium]